MALEDEEITEEDVKVPINELVVGNKKQVNILDMADYADIFFAIENTVLHYWSDINQDVNDQDVLKAYNNLLEDFDNQKEETLASEISKSVKGFLIIRAKEKQREYTYGEIISCISYLRKTAHEHKSSDGVGYLKWVKAFFDGDMPLTVDGIAEYIFQNEL